MGSCEQDRARARQQWPGFRALIIGFHWPSQPWGDEDSGGSFDAGAGQGETAFVEDWSDRIADTEPAREALRVLYRAAQDDIDPDRLPGQVVDAYRTLDREAALRADGVGGAPDGDREPLDPQLSYEDWQNLEATSFGGGSIGGLLSPLRQLSFWTMKKRARSVGEQGGHQLLRDLAARTAPPLRVHLMGHSFGCIVVSSMLRGPDGDGIRVSSVLLAQGAMSLWSYASELPTAAGTPGYFRQVIDGKCVAGPIVVTTSKFDKAVGTLYPLAAGAAGQVEYDPAPGALPKYGAIGTFGLQGKGLPLDRSDLTLDLSWSYRFAPGRVYNLNGDAVIRTGGGLSGAHSDIAHPELGHAFWEAALASPANRA
jgi:hypothetical protein